MCEQKEWRISGFFFFFVPPRPLTLGGVRNRSGADFLFPAFPKPYLSQPGSRKCQGGDYFFVRGLKVQEHWEDPFRNHSVWHGINCYFLCSDTKHMKGASCSKEGFNKCTFFSIKISTCFQQTAIKNYIGGKCKFYAVFLRLFWPQAFSYGDILL